MIVNHIQFPSFTGIRCLMMPYIQGEPSSVPDEYKSYYDIIRCLFVTRGDIGYLTIDESPVNKGMPHRGARAKFDRALHTEVGRNPAMEYCWGGGWGNSHHVTLDADVQILLANNLSNSCAIWYTRHEHTSIDGDIGDKSSQYPYATAVMMQAGDVHRIGILTPHESLPVRETLNRQFLRIISSGVHGREQYFTLNQRMLTR